MNFTGHSLLGLLAGSLAGLVVAGLGPTNLQAVPLPFLVPATVLGLVYLGAVYPDVDLRGSIPRKRVRPYLEAVAVGGVALVVVLYPDWFVEVGQAILASVDLTAGPTVAGASAALCGALLAVAAVDPLLGLLTGPHRTVTHSVGANAIAAGVVAAALWLAVPLAGRDRLVVAVLPFAFVLGVAVHRLADGAW